MLRIHQIFYFGGISWKSWAVYISCLCRKILLMQKVNRAADTYWERGTERTGKPVWVYKCGQLNVNGTHPGLLRHPAAKLKSLTMDSQYLFLTMPMNSVSDQNLNLAFNFQVEDTKKHYSLCSSHHRSSFAGTSHTCTHAEIRSCRWRGPK